jgi:hypothetical protein
VFEEIVKVISDTELGFLGEADGIRKALAYY